MSEKKFAFKKITPKSYNPDDPESLFRDLKGRDPSIQSLWSHQADIIREYHNKFMGSKDVALQLPTGSGKTLVGLLIGEYHRLKYGKRVLYLCPTKQLVHQVHSYAKTYGIKAHAFVGKQTEYPTKEFNDYVTSDAIAISTYSALFNFNPRFDNSNVIICDDAHGSEGYISSMWSLNISFDHDLFTKIVNLFEDELPTVFVNQLKTKSRSQINPIIEKVPNHIFLNRLKELSELLDENISNEEKNLYYSWRTIQDNLSACNLFVSRNEVLIRPWIPPTLSHSPFSNASQRIYMSATLGAGGELERIIGIPKIERLSIPHGWDKQGSGRRLFVFPDYNYSLSEYIGFLAKIIHKRNRTLILCPNKDIADIIKQALIREGVLHDFYDSYSIEESLDSFTSSNAAILLLTNRYDGIDLPGDACRQLLMVGYPGFTNLQEGFLLSRLEMDSLLSDRVITRFTQATGRCTRGSTDYSLVIPIGTELFEFCLAKENNEKLHPELQAELYFGLEQCKDADLDDLESMVDIFMEQGDDWKGAEENILLYRDQTVVSEDPKTKSLSDVVSEEVNFEYNLWNKNYPQAIEYAQSIIGSLNGTQFDGYRAIWNYFAGSAALLQFNSTKDSHWSSLSFDYFDRAKSCANMIGWFSELPSFVEKEGGEPESVDTLSGYALDNIQALLHKLKPTGPLFEKKMKVNHEYIYDDTPSAFEEGLTALGKLLGFESYHPGGDADPDSVWTLNDEVIILFEAKSSENSEGVISVDTCRQSQGHYKWAGSFHRDYETYKKKICVVVSKRSKLDKNAIVHSGDLYYIHIDETRQMFETISGLLRRIRSQSGTYNKESIRIKLLEELESSKLTPKGIISLFENRPLTDLAHNR
ncbi:DEAD/DEAH box helicase family protein [Methanolobus mangrovi]|uniref:DEAD/DEAH box helicase family protein n=1 Tax=Methanolobus mangrovi TaxID=3072977 RepID=A0AA51UGI4_9EURY|nr:DEAD/DEAH box helicase family protein [Methanolobus mangrovi]WMW22783.1 DEAD/DEAH box helicase family protein [Methanolobus mangrovi]